MSQQGSGQAAGARQPVAFNALKSDIGHGEPAAGGEPNIVLMKCGTVLMRGKLVEHLAGRLGKDRSRSCVYNALPVFGAVVLGSCIPFGFPLMT